MRCRTLKVPSAANQHMFWRSLICSCWMSSMEQSANPAARVRYRYYTQTISTSTQNASIWSLTAAAPTDSVFHALCINWLTYLLTYLLKTKTTNHITADLPMILSTSAAPAMSNTNRYTIIPSESEPLCSEHQPASSNFSLLYT